jgi:hypothetical protein
LEPSWTYSLGEDLNESVRRRDHEVFIGIIPKNGHEPLFDGRIRISDLATNVATEKTLSLRYGWYLSYVYQEKETPDRRTEPRAGWYPHGEQSILS